MKKMLDCYDEKDLIEKCRKCGTTTTIEMTDFDGSEIHVCPACNYRYKLVFRDDDTEDESEVSHIPSKKSPDFWK